MSDYYVLTSEMRLTSIHETTIVSLFFCSHINSSNLTYKIHVLVKINVVMTIYGSIGWK